MEWLIKLDADLLRQVVIQIATFLVFFVIVKVFFADKIKAVLDQRKEAIEHDLTEAAKANEKVAKAIAGMQIVKVIHVKNKLVNLIVKPC